jgi:DnaJ-class molecular chaperone
VVVGRFHPDNQDSGSQEIFRRIMEAYQVLSDTTKRAAYEVDYSATRRLQWKIFDQARSTEGFEAERRKRKGILGLL